MQRGLLVDDDDAYRRTLQRSLERRGLHVDSAADGATAVAMAGLHAPDFILLDLNLVGETGLDLIAPLRAAAPSARIVVVTGYASVATAVEAIKRGADNYLPKPATADAIVRMLGASPATSTPIEDQMTPMSRLEWEHIQQAMTDSQGNISAAARLLGMHRRSLQRKLSKRPGRERLPIDELD